jgi:hypothetical protein
MDMRRLSLSLCGFESGDAFIERVVLLPQVTERVSQHGVHFNELPFVFGGVPGKFLVDVLDSFGTLFDLATNRLDLKLSLLNLALETIESPIDLREMRIGLREASIDLLKRVWNCSRASFRTSSIRRPGSFRPLTTRSTRSVSAMARSYLGKRLSKAPKTETEVRTWSRPPGWRFK